MSTEGDERNTSTAHTAADGLSPEERGQEGTSTLSRGVISRLSWAQRAVSPWVRRALQAGRAAGARDGGGRWASTALSYGATSRFLRRAQRLVEGSRSWQPELGSLDPQSMTRFSEEVTARYPDPVRHHVSWLPEEEADHATEFPLAGQVQPPPGRPAGERRLPAMPASRSTAPQVPPAIGTGMEARPDSRSATVQREPTRRGPPPRPTKPPPSGRLYAHVEELPATREEAVPEGDLAEPAMPPGAPNRAPEVSRSTGEQIWRAVDAEQPSEDAARGPGTAPVADIQRRASTMPSVAGGEAGERVPRQSEASRSAGTQQPAEERLGPPAPARASPRDAPPAMQRAAERQGAPQAPEPRAREEATEGAVSPPAALPRGLDRAAGRGHPQQEEEAEVPDGAPEAVVPRPAQAQLPPQGRDMPTAHRRATPSTPAEASRQAESPPPDQPRAVQQIETLAAQPSPVQEDTAAPLAAAEGEEAVERREESERGHRAQGRASIPPRAERSPLQVEGASFLPSRGPQEQHGQAAPQVELPSSPQAAQRSADQVERTASVEGAAVDAKASSAPELQSEGRTMRLPEGGVVQPAPAERGVPSARPEEGPPAADRGATPPHDAAARLPGAEEDGGDQLPLAAASRASIQRAAVSGESDAGEPTGTEPQAPPSTAGSTVTRRQIGPTAPRSRAAQRREQLPLAQRAPAEPGMSVQALHSKGDREGAVVAAEPAVPSAEGTAGTEQVPKAPERDRPSASRADTGPSAGPARERPVSRLVQRSTTPPMSPARAEPAPETVVKGEIEGLPDGGAEPQDAAAPLQRRAVGQQRPVADARRPNAAGIAGAETAPWQELPSGRASRGEPGAGGEREGSPLAAPFVSPRPVVQTKPLAETAILPQARRVPAPGARAAQGRAYEPPPLAQRVSQPVAGTTPAGSAAAPAPVARAVTPQPTPERSAEATVQRQPSTPSISRPDVAETAAVQRALEKEPSAEGQVQDEGEDLDRLAREVYPLVVRLLAVERERRTGRWG